MVVVNELSSLSPKKPRLDVADDSSDSIDGTAWSRGDALVAQKALMPSTEFELRAPRLRGGSRGVAFSPSKRIVSFDSLAPTSTQTPVREEAMRDYRRAVSASANRDYEEISFLGPSRNSRQAYQAATYQLGGNPNSSLAIRDREDQSDHWPDLENESRRLARASADYDSTGGDDLTTDASDASFGNPNMSTSQPSATPSQRRRKPVLTPSSRKGSFRKLLSGGFSSRRGSMNNNHDNNVADTSANLTSDSDFQSDPTQFRRPDDSMDSVRPSPVPATKSNRNRPKGPADHYSQKWYFDPDTPRLLQSYLQLLFNAVMIFTAIYLATMFVYTVRRDVDMRVAEYTAEICNEIDQCAQNFLSNRCQPGTRVPALDAMCNEWEVCMNRDPKLVGRAKVSAETFGHILNSFMEPISLKSLIFIVSLYLGTFMLVNVYLPSKSSSFFKRRAAACAEPGSSSYGAGASGTGSQLESQYYDQEEVPKTPSQRRKNVHQTPRSHRR